LGDIFGTELGPAHLSTSAQGQSAVRSICIVGGGTAGWMTALLLHSKLADPSVQICLVESDQVGIIGVGEGSTPALKGFFDDLGISEAEWMPACHATYKCGITFKGWSTRPGFERYFHPFASTLDNVTGDLFVHHCRARVAGVDLPAHPDRFFLATQLAQRGLSPKAQPDFPFEVLHGYHFDSTLLGQYLRQVAVRRGVKHLVRHVQKVRQHENGDIACLTTREGDAIEADFFVDCTGFAGLLIDQTLRAPFVPFAENLFNDAAIAVPTELDGQLPSETVSTALPHGWVWKIPLTSRYGNGYVYSSAYCSADQAEFELRQHLGLLEADVPLRHLKMKVGRVEQHWKNNCLAVGLSQGFIEPLEATALLVIQRTASTFAGFFNAGDLGPQPRERFNAVINESFETTRDYIVAHYKTTTRSDTPYWVDNARNVRLSPRLRQLLGLWMHGQPLPASVKGSYPLMSWYALLAGMGLFPEPETLRAARAEEQTVDLEGLDDFIERSTRHFLPHAQAVQAPPAPHGGKSLKIYRFL
jgi:glycine/D-amino acid oxidase-like deaminating enzyme